MVPKDVWSLAASAAGLAMAAALAVAAILSSADTPSTVHQPVIGISDLLRVFQEGKDAAEQADPPEISLGPSFEPQRDYR